MKTVHAKMRFQTLLNSDVNYLRNKLNIKKNFQN